MPKRGVAGLLGLTPKKQREELIADGRSSKRAELIADGRSCEGVEGSRERLGIARLGLAGDGNFKFINFVQSISEEDEQCSRKKNINFVHVLLIKKKTFVTVTDAKGNKKTGASAGCLEERKGRSRLSRYAAEATAEHVGRSARKMGLKSVVMKVKGSTFFRKKKKVILSWREGF
ncbi:probable ribosomal protein S11, mitochondrial [Phalaenopsis equestris]|uniref:probable ribosomal protein S11, mitochondrial n=1 Tax=Phalaenopsis equestris TaxID=78828 RepID=UPI0009E3A2DC|nr:probable ribosomal protein S11, mitochondrial [Phalaenopsis equestris]